MNHRLRVLTIGHSYCVAMNRALVREVARDPDVDITVAAPRFFHGDLRPIVMEPEPPGSQLRVVPLGTKRSRFVHIFEYDSAALRQLVRKGDFDVVHAWEEPYILVGYQIARVLQNNPARFCFRTFQNYVKHYPPPFGYFERTVLARAQGWIASASLVYQAMLDRGFPKEAGRILNLAVDLAAFHPLSSEARAEVLRELGLRPPVVGFVGRLTKAKGLDVLMQAMEKVGAPRHWSLLLLGSGDYRGKVMEWAAKNGWSDRVKIILAKHSDVPRYVGCMDLLAAPSQTMKNWREQFGRMLIEAFASGVPVIGSDSGEIPYVIADAGRVVAEADVVGWAHAIDQLLNSAPEREELRRRCLERAAQYSVATIARQYREYYRWLAGRSLTALAPASRGPKTAGPDAALTDARKHLEFFDETSSSAS
jgi:phosphatidyl-myo-inositol dimannoside synthase